MKCIFIYNPNSGRGKIKRRLNLIKRKLLTKYDTVDIYETQAPKDIYVKAREFANFYDTIVFSGGDGTFNEMVHALAPLEKMPSLGYIPSGTVNDIAKSLAIPHTVRGALNVVLKGSAHKFDCVLINKRRYAMYVVCAGAFTSAPYSTDQKSKKVIGKLAYGIEGIRKNLDFKVFPVKVETDGHTIETNTVLILAMNGKSIAGLPINNASSMRDGELEVALIQQDAHPNIFKKARAYISLAHLVLLGYRKNPENKIIRLHGRSFRFTVGDDVVWDYDGEMGDSGSLELEVVQKRVKIIVNSQKILKKAR